MSVSYISASGASTTTGTTSVVIPAPAEILDNDILLAQIHTEDASAAVTSVPSGFTLLASYTATNFRHYIYWKRASAESGSYTFAATSAGFMAGGVQLLRAAIQSGDPFTVVGSWGTGTGTTSTAPGITTTSPDSLVLFLGDSENGGNYTVPSGMIERYDGGVYLAELVQSAPGAVSSKAATVSVSQEWTSILVAIAPHDGITYIGSASTPADGATATGTSATPAVTPPVGVRVGDIVVFTAMTRDSAGQSFAISQASGQSWSSVNAIANTNIAAGMFYSRFNGSWGSNPSIAVSGGTSPYSAVMHVYRPPFPEATWAVDQAFTELDFTAPGSPFTVTITGQTTTKGHTVTLAGWFTADENTWGSISGTGWVVPGSAQYRNTSGSDLSATFAHKIQTAAGATGNVSQNQATLGGDAGTTFIVTFYPLLSGTGAKTQGAQTVSSGGTVSTGGAGTPTQGAQTSAGAGTISITGTGAATQAGDTTTAAGSVGNDGQGAVTQGADTLASAGTVGASGIDGAGAPTQAADTAAGAGSVGVVGASATTQAADAGSGAGTVGIGGAASVTQDAQVGQAAGILSVSGAGVVTQADDSVDATGTISVRGQGAQSQGAQTAQSAGSVPITGTGSGTDGADTASAQGSIGITGSASITQDADTLESASAGGVSGSGSVTQGAQQATGSGTVGIGGDGSGSQEPDVIAASGDVSISGDGSGIQSQDEITAQGSVSLTGSGAATQGDHTLVAVGSAGTIVYVGVTTIVGLSRTYTANAQAALTRVQDVDRSLTVAPMNTQSVESLSQSYTVEAIQ